MKRLNQRRPIAQMCAIGLAIALLAGKVEYQDSHYGRSYIFALWFLLSSFFLFSSPNLSRRRLDVYHTSTHGVALV